MKRREFSIHLAGTGLAFAAAPALAQGGPVEGTHYIKLAQPLAASMLPPAGKIDATEFFWYECPHCNAFEPMLEAWTKKLPDDVLFRRVPVGFTARHVAAQKMFYALESMGKLEALHRKIFAAIHVQNQRLIAESDMVAFVKANGVDGDKFSEAFRSFDVATKANRAKQLTDAYKIDGVPSLGIHGRFFTSGSLTGSYDKALAVTDFLIQRARSGA